MSRTPRPARGVALVALVFAVACLGPRRSVRREWQTEVAWSFPSKLGGCAVGELDPRAPGAEIVAVASTGAVHELHRGPGGWEHTLVAQTSGELVQCAVGDAVLAYPGNEILAVGMKAGREEDGGAGTAWLFVDAGEPRRLAIPLLDEEALIHAGCIADVDPERPGAEIVVAGFARAVHVLAYDGAGFLEQVVARLDGPAKQVAPWQGGIAVACANGELVLVAKGADGWEQRTLARAPSGLARLDARGDECLVARDDGVLWLVRADGSTQELWRESEKLRGAVLADVDPDVPGFEAATCGYSGAIRSFGRTASGGWDGRTLVQDDEPLHHLSAGEVDGAGLGFELVGCGYSGRVFVVRLTKVVHG